MGNLMPFFPIFFIIIKESIVDSPDILGFQTMDSTNCGIEIFEQEIPESLKNKTSIYWALAMIWHSIYFTYNHYIVFTLWLW